MADRTHSYWVNQLGHEYDDDPDQLLQRQPTYDYAQHGPVGVGDQVVYRAAPNRQSPSWTLGHGNVHGVGADGTAGVKSNRGGTKVVVPPEHILDVPFSFSKGNNPYTAKRGGIQTQAEQFPDRVAVHGGQTEAELPPKHPTDDIQIHRNTGLYGEDEDHPVDFIGRPSPKGNGYDVIRQIPT